MGENHNRNKANRQNAANAVMDRAHPLTGQNAREIQPYGAIVRLPIASGVSSHAR